MDADRHGSERERVEELKREERLIRAWIREVMGRKQARLRAIRAELRALAAAKAAGPAEPAAGVTR